MFALELSFNDYSSFFTLKRDIYVADFRKHISNLNINQKSISKLMKKALLVIAAVACLAVVSTSCGKGCHCYVKTDITHIAPVFEDESMNKSDCAAKEQALNDEAGMDFYNCK